MARARNIKPGFFKNEVLAEMPALTRLLFIALWTYADREGRFEYRPRRIKADLFPYESIDVEDGIGELADAGFLVVYEADGTEYVQVRNWSKHQNPHHKEVGSVIPAPDGHVDTVCAGYIPLSNTIRRRIYERDGRKCRECGAEHGLSIDHIIPISRGGNSIDSNLQVLCITCNARKNNRILSTTDDKSMHEPCMGDGSAKKVAPSPTDSLIPDSLQEVHGEKRHASSRRERKKKGEGEQTLASWVLGLPEDEEVIRNDDRIFVWAEEVGIPREWIAVAWTAFENRYGEDEKTYSDWRAVFRKAIKADWMGLWRHRNGQWELTTAGLMAQRERHA